MRVQVLWNIAVIIVICLLPHLVVSCGPGSSVSKDISPQTEPPNAGNTEQQILNLESEIIKHGIDVKQATWNEVSYGSLITFTKSEKIPFDPELWAKAKKIAIKKSEGRYENIYFFSESNPLMRNDEKFVSEIYVNSSESIMLLTWFDSKRFKSESMIPNQLYQSFLKTLLAELEENKIEIPNSNQPLKLRVSALYTPEQISKIKFRYGAAWKTVEEEIDSSTNVPTHTFLSLTLFDHKTEAQTITEAIQTLRKSYPGKNLMWTPSLDHEITFLPEGTRFTARQTIPLNGTYAFVQNHEVTKEWNLNLDSFYIFISIYNQKKEMRSSDSLVLRTVWIDNDYILGFGALGSLDSMIIRKVEKPFTIGELKTYLNGIFEVNLAATERPIIVKE